MGSDKLSLLVVGLFIVGIIGMVGCIGALEGELEEHTLTVNVQGEAALPEEGVYVHQKGSEVGIRADSEEGWEFVEWTGDYEGVEEEITITMDEDKEVTAHFVEETTDYELRTEIEGQGTLSVEPDQDRYEEGVEVTVTVTSDEGWYFDQWLGDVEGDKSSQEKVNVTMDRDKELLALLVNPEQEVSLNAIRESEVDEECGWVSVNCCPPQAGANWVCLNKEETTVECPENPICLQVVVGEPKGDCVSINGTCTVENAGNGFSIVD